MTNPPNDKSSKSMSRYVWYAATLLVMFVLGADGVLFRPAVASTTRYHAAVKAQAEAIPFAFGTWVGLDVPVPEAAVRLLRPNVIISRRYENLSTGEIVSFLLVEVTDARDILGHYPPVCYRAQGWSQLSATSTDWGCRSGAVQGVEYVFSRDRLDGPSKLLISNALFLPDGETARDMDEVEIAAQSRLRKPFGAGQLQLVFSSSVGAERRQMITKEFLELLEPVRAVRTAGVGVQNAAS